MKILIDTREQRPLQFAWPSAKTCLPFGDYGCELADKSMVPVIFERKSIADLFGTLSKGYERFRKMLRKAEAGKVKIIVIVEGSLSKVIKGYSRSQRSGISIVKQLYTIRAIYGIEIVFCQNRDEMALYIEKLFDSYRRLKI